MLVPDEITQTTDALEQLPDAITRMTDDLEGLPDAMMRTTDDLEELSDAITSTTESLEQLPRTLDRRSALSERRQSMLQQKQTDDLPALTLDTPHTKIAWRQVVALREENRRLRFALEDQQAELQQLLSDYTTLKDGLDQEIAVIHNGHQQEIEQYQSHLQALMDERNRLHNAYSMVDLRYQDLYHTFQDAVEDEAQKMMTEATQTIMLTPDKAPALWQDVVKTLEIQVRQAEDKHLVEALYLKHEVQRTLAQLEQEREQVDAERQCLVVLQNSAREQAELRHKTLHERLHTRWRVASVATSLGLLGALMVLQFVSLFLFQVHLTTSISLAMLLPVIVCTVLALALVNPLKWVKHIYNHIPVRRKQ